MSRRTKVKLALCVGLNYPGTSAELLGCVNDANDAADAFDDFGYRPKVLLEPTKAELVASLKENLAHLRWGDRFIFWYSGHGTKIVDRDGDESDNYDEALVCADYRQRGILLDDELYLLANSRARGSRMYSFSDSCHSGSVNKFFHTEGATGRVKYLPFREALEGDELQATLALQERVTLTKPRVGTLLFSGCRDDEYSYDAEFNGRANGAFTYHALQALSNKPKNMRDWNEQIRFYLPTSQYPQTPQFTAMRHQKYWSL